MLEILPTCHFVWRMEHYVMGARLHHLSQKLCKFYLEDGNIKLLSITFLLQTFCSNFPWVLLNIYFLKAKWNMNLLHLAKGLKVPTDREFDQKLLFVLLPHYIIIYYVMYEIVNDDDDSCFLISFSNISDAAWCEVHIVNENVKVKPRQSGWYFLLD